MKNMYFFIFISIVSILCFSLHYYLYIRAIQTFSFSMMVKKYISIAYFILASLFIIGMFLQHSYSSLLSEIIYKLGATWLSFFLYFLLIVVCIDLVRLANHFFHFLPVLSPCKKNMIGSIVIVAVMLIVLIGHINAKLIKIHKIDLQINKKVKGENNIRILMVSDIHLGAIIGEQWEKKLLAITKEQQPDLVLFCGDIIDGDVHTVLRKKLGKHIKQIKAPLGVFAVSGNHEYIGDIKTAISFLESVDIKVLEDQSFTLENGIQIIGRKDIQSKYNKNNTPLLSLEELLQNVDLDRPIIVMKHQPVHLNEAVEAGVDLHLSGHTHHGQLWPINYVTQLLFKISYGYQKINNTHFYVSSGFGTWGPSVRLGNRPEVVLFNIEFQ